MKDHVLSFLSAYQDTLSQAFTLPTELSQEYELYDCLRETQTKSTYLLRKKADDSFAILKVATKSARDHLRSEYDILKNVRAPQLPQAISFFSDQNSTYFLREYIAGTPVSDYVERRGTFSEAEAVHLCLGLCDALQVLHFQTPPIIHRDIKPQNVILTQQHTLALIDFDAARRYSSEQKKDTVYLGTQATAAPEQFGYQQTDQRSDIYSTGILLLFLCTGSYELQAVSQLSSRGLRHCIETCTRFDPNRRFATTKALRRCLQRLERSYARSSASFWRGIAVGLACGVGLCAALLLLRGIPAAPAQASGITASLDAAAITPRATVAITFDSPQIEQAVRAQLGFDAQTPLYQSDLDQVTTLYLFGTNTVIDWNTTISNSLYHTSDPAGTIISLSDIPKLRNLTELSLCNQHIVDLSPLKGMRLVRLALSGNQITDLTPLNHLPLLRELLIGHNPITHIDVLRNLTQLQVVDLSSTSVSDISALSENMTAVYLAETPVSDYRPLLSMHFLQSLFITHPDPDDMAVLSQLTSLTDLVLNDNLANIALILGLENLQRLALLQTRLTSIEGLEALDHLIYLRMIASPNLDLTPLSKMPQLAELDIYNQQLSDYSAILQIPNLRILYCSAEQKAGVEALGLPFAFQIIVI